MKTSPCTNFGTIKIHFIVVFVGIAMAENDIQHLQNAYTTDI